MRVGQDHQVEWDSRLWDQVWERNLTQVERHNLALAVILHRPPGSPFEDVVARELAVRWRRRAVALATVYTMWTVFWGLLALTPWPQDVEPSALPMGCTIVGVVAIACCALAWHRYGRYVALVDADVTADLVP